MPLRDPAELGRLAEMYGLRPLLETLEGINDRLMTLEDAAEVRPGRVRQVPPPQIGQACDPDLERILLEEEEIERRQRAHVMPFPDSTIVEPVDVLPGEHIVGIVLRVTTVVPDVENEPDFRDVMWLSTRRGFFLASEAVHDLVEAPLGDRVAMGDPGLSHDVIVDLVLNYVRHHG